MSGVSLTDEVLIENLIEHLSVSRMKNSFYKFYRHNCARTGVCAEMICTPPPPSRVASHLPREWEANGRFAPERENGFRAQRGVAGGASPSPTVGEWRLCAEGILCGNGLHAGSSSRCGSVTLGV